MPRWTCPKCKDTRFVGRDEIERGHCSSCEVASWSLEKQVAFKKLLAVGMRGMCGGCRATEAEKDALIDEALKHV